MRTARTPAHGASASSTGGAEKKGPSATTTAGGGTTPETQSAVLENLPGSPSPGCAVVGERSDVRAGTLAIGNFVDMRKTYSAQAKTKEQPEVSMYVIPRQVKPDSGVSVLLESLQGKGRRTVRVSSAQTAGEWRYYRST